MPPSRYLDAMTASLAASDRGAQFREAALKQVGDGGRHPGRQGRHTPYSNCADMHTVRDHSPAAHNVGPLWHSEDAISMPTKCYCGL